MSFKTFLERHLSDILACVVVIVCVLALVISNIVFWILSPVILMIYFWRKYNFWIILCASLYLFIMAFLWGVESRTNETINVAAHLLVLGIVLGAASIAEKRLSLFRKIKFKEHLLPYLVIAVFVIVIGWYYGALTANPLGDDAFLHVGKIQFITDNFPNINWYPYWYLGFDMFESYPPTYYFLVGLTNVMTGVSVTQLMVFFLFFAMFLLGVGVYKFSEYVDLPWYVGMVFSLMFLSLPAVWGSTITGGAYLRSFSLPFYVISLIAVYLHVSRVNEKNGGWKTFISVIFLLSFTFSLHLMAGFFTAVATVLLYLLAVRGIKQKIKTLLKVFIPVGGLVSWFYLPLLRYYFSAKGFGTHDLTLPGFERFFISSNPILLSFTLMLAAVFIFSYYRHRPIIKREKISVLAVFLVLSVYFFLFGWLSMPESAYIMAAYDYRGWFVFSLTLFLITLSSLLYPSFSASYSNKLNNSLQKDNSQSLARKAKRNKTFIEKFLVTTTILMLFGAFTISLPSVNRTNLNPDDPNSFVYGLSSTVDNINAELPSNYRLTGVSRRLHTLHPSKFPQLEYALGRQSGSTHAYYDLIFKERVFFRYNEDQLLYHDDRLHMSLEIPYISSNFFSAMFLMDWFGVDGVVKAPWDRVQTLNEYGLKKQFFNTTEFSGGMTYIQYDGSSPILVSTNATTVGVLTDEKDGESLYRAVFLTLGELNLNSQWVIPLKINESNLEDDLQNIATILVTSDKYQSYENLLQKYVNDGGNLVIMGHEHNNSELKKAELSKSGLIFYTRASPLTHCEGSEAIAKTEEGIVICKSKVGAGSITKATVSILELYEDASPVASAVLGTILIPDMELCNISPKADSGNVNYRKNAIGKVTQSNDEKVLEFELMQNVAAQINFRFIFNNKASTSANGILQFELWNDDKTSDLTLNIVHSSSSNYLSYTLSNASWVGWKTFSIPLASFITGSPELLKDFNGVDLVVTNANQTLENSEYTLKIKNLGFYKAKNNAAYQPVDYEWITPNQLKISIKQDITIKHLLWKESYVEHWKIHTTPETQDVKFYNAGPGVILIHIPSSSNIDEIVITMPLTEIRLAGIIFSVITLILLLILPLYRRFFIK